MSNLVDDWYHQLHEKISHRLLQAVRKILPLGDAEEVVQDTLLRVYERRAQYAFKTIDPLLFRIARNIALDRLRHKAVTELNKPKWLIHQQLNNHSDCAETTLREQQEGELLIAAVNSMSPICRQVFVYRKFEGLKHSDIARIMHISPKTVEAHLARGMRHCRRYVESQTPQNVEPPIAAARISTAASGKTR